jgi:hypothetical protein
MCPYKVMVDDNFHFMEEDERHEHGIFPTAEEALAACRAIVDRDLEARLKPGMSAQALYGAYEMSGSDPFIVATGDAPKISFSAWDYAKQRSAELAPDAR